MKARKMISNHSSRSFGNRFGRFIVAAATIVVVACSGPAHPPASAWNVSDMRSSAKSSSDPDRVANWLLAEMLAPGGTHGGAARAAKRLEDIGPSTTRANAALGVFAERHGNPERAAKAYALAIDQARRSDDPDGQLLGWYAADRLHALRASISGLYKRYRPTIDDVVRRPGRIGWRAHSELVDWSIAEVFESEERTGPRYDKLVVDRVGCATNVRLAGPFGHGVPADRRTAYPAEAPGPWPFAWPRDPQRGQAPHQLKTERRRCLTNSTEHAGAGVFYAETYFDTAHQRDLLVAVQGSVAVWVDDRLVLRRDLRDWGIWQRFGAVVRVPAGRHRLLARIVDDSTTIRILNPDGTPAHVKTSSDAAPGYSLERPVVVANPNPLEGLVRDSSSLDPARAFFAAHAAHLDQMDDVASAWLARFAQAEHAAPVMLEAAAQYAEGDAAYPADQRRRRERTWRSRAVLGDRKLWFSRGWLAIDLADQRGLTEGVTPLRDLTKEFPNVPDVALGLARLYARLGWRAERMQTCEDLATRFPDHVEVLEAYLEALDEDGPAGKADEIAKRIKHLKPTSDIELERALARRDYDAALRELKRLAANRPHRKEFAERIARVLTQAGDSKAGIKQLEDALAKHPDDGAVRFKLADFAYARGDERALFRALASAIEAGAPSGPLRTALALIEGSTTLDPFRIDGRRVVREFQAWESSGQRMDGHAARVLDYAAVWVHPDGSSDMLEHEIQKIQSQEAINQESEQKRPEGLVLSLRVIKADGSVFEPEPVVGKPTLTLPHLEVGDFVELERIVPMRGDGEKGRTYRGPHWFFREIDKGYWRSEFVALVPKSRTITIETRGDVPKSDIVDLGSIVSHRWRVDESPPAVQEPASVSALEFLPSVRLGWGIDRASTIARLVEMAEQETPLDPRVARIAEAIVKGTPPNDTAARARKLYAWVLDKIEDGRERDGRRAVMGKSGSRQDAFVYLARLLHIPVEHAVAKTALATPAAGPISEAETLGTLVLRVGSGKTAHYFTIGEKFAPYGYLPPELRHQPVIRLVRGAPEEKTGDTSSPDLVELKGRIVLDKRGTAKISLDETFSGGPGASLRAALHDVAPSSRRDFVEAKLLARHVPGAHVESLKIVNEKSIDRPLKLHIEATSSDVVRARGDRWVLRPLFNVRVAQLAPLPDRETPMVITGGSHLTIAVDIIVPETAKMPSSLPREKLQDGERHVTAADEVNGHALRLARSIHLPIGRIAPGTPYRRFRTFVQRADALFDREMVIGKP